MAGYKETPRQKMISMMYLVLTALLALNVSKEMLDAFIVVNESVVLTNENFAQKLKDTYTTFEKNYQLNQNKVRPFWEKAKEAQLLSNEMVKYVANLRNELISKTEGISVDSAKTVPIMKLKNKVNYDTPTNFFMGDTQDGSRGKARELKNKINEYRQKMLELVGAKYRHLIKLGLKTDGTYYNASGQEINWEEYNFFYTILAADITILNKIITEVYNAEFDVVNILLDAISAEDFKYDMIDAKVLPKSDYIFIGDDYEAEIIVAAYDTKQNPEVYLMEGVDSLPVNQQAKATPIEGKAGIVKIKFPARSSGIKRYAGFVAVKTSEGDINNYFFNDEYVVAEPSLTVSAIKMNVFYIGVDNPVSISVPGIPEENLIPSISCGTLKRDPSGDYWVVKVPPGNREAIIKVMAELNGSKREMGSKKFRIKKVPDPIALIANKNEGLINRNILIAAGSIIPKMPDDFEFDLSFRIVSFKMTIQRGLDVYPYKSNSGRLTEEMTKQIKAAYRGQKIWFENIVASGPDGIDRPLSPIILTIN